MSGHTPGPWRYQYVGEIDFRAPEPDDFCILSDDRTCTATSWGGRWDKGEANARLIAAAPELLAAARETVSAMTDRFSLMGADDDYIYDELGSELAAAFFSARAAIAKATGEAA